MPALILMYHDLAENLEEIPPGHRPYVLNPFAFRRQLDSAAQSSLKVLTVAEWCSQPKPASAPPQAARLTLIGVISGPTPLAVIRYGEQRFFVQEGGTIAQPSRYVVKSIRPGQIVLAGKQDKLVLNMRGGR